MTISVVVLDAYALVAFIEAEPGAEEVASLLARAGERSVSLLVTSVNLVGLPLGPTVARTRHRDVDAYADRRRQRQLASASHPRRAAITWLVS